MKRTALFSALLLTALLLSSGCGSPDISLPQSAPVSSASSQTSKQTSETKQSSAPEISAPESSAPESSEEPEPSAEPQEAKIWSLAELLELLASKGVDSTSADALEGIKHDYKGVMLTRAELVFRGSADETTELLQELGSCDADGLYLTDMTLTRDYDIFTANLRIENPYPDPEGSSDSAKAYIRSHWGGLDRAALIKAFVEENMDFQLAGAKAMLFSDKSGVVRIEAGIDFSGYDGFVTYRYKLTNSDSFNIDGRLEVQKTEGEDAGYPLHTDAVLLTDKFTKQQV